jgi:hypothetical protein
MRDRDLVPVFYMCIFSFPTPFVKEAVYSPIYVFGNINKNQMAVAL